MKRLFYVRDPKNRPVRIPNEGKFFNDEGPTYFPSKEMAKCIRDELNEWAEKHKAPRPYTIGRGPDHWRGES